MNFSAEFDHEYSVNEGEKVLDLSSYHGDGLGIIVHELVNKQMGGADAKSAVYGRFVDKDGVEHGEKIPMFIKAARVNNELFGEEKYSMSESVRYLERWKFLRDIGVPVVPNIVAIGDDRIAMVDITANGGMFFGKEKSYNLFADVDKGVKKELTMEEKNFLKVDIKKVCNEIDRIESIMSKHNVDFPLDDALELFVLPDGSWKILVVDLTGLQKAKKGASFSKKSRLERIGFEIMKKNLLKLSQP